MIMTNTERFDFVHDSQETFRLMLYAISNPGEIVNIADMINKISDDHSHLLVTALTLLDKETSYAVIGDKKLEEVIGQLTYANKVNEKASYIFVNKECSKEEISNVFKKANPGTMIDPYISSTIIISAPIVKDALKVSIEGPGVKDAKEIKISEYIKEWIEQRDTARYEYPLGVDLYFVSSNGDLLSIPRKVKMRG